MTVFAQLHNAIDYPLRQLFRWGRGGLRWRNESKAEAYAQNPQAAAEAQRLLTTYDLTYFAQHSRARNYRENLYYLALLESALASPLADGGQPSVGWRPSAEGWRPSAEGWRPPAEGWRPPAEGWRPPAEGWRPPAEGWRRAIDIGASDWFYVHAYYAFLKRHQAAAELIGYEADAFRVYGDLHSRQDYARAHLRGLPADRVIYEPRAFATQPTTNDLVTLFFPFVFEHDHLAWGLPRGLFRPQALLAAAWASLKPGGALLVVNQGDDEHAAQKAMFAVLGIPIMHAARFESPLFHYSLSRHVIRAEKSVD